MTKESEITPFSKRANTNNSSASPTSKSARMRQVATALQWGGLVGFWIQLILGVISTVTLALAITNQAERNNAGISFSLFCAVCGLICLVVGICIAFRYGKMARQFATPGTAPPKKSTTIKLVQISVITSIVGMFLTILGAETIAGIVLSKVLVFDPAKVFNNQSNSEFVNSLDIFIIQANIHIIAAHLTGIVSSLWILSRIDK
ncbi:MAG: DUF3611 family protein [Waterburya sp.]